MFKAPKVQPHYKMYKKGKFWLVAGAFSMTLAISTTKAQAETAAAPEAAPAETATSAQTTPDNTVTLTPSSAADVATPATSTADTTPVTEAETPESPAPVTAKPVTSTAQQPSSAASTAEGAASTAPEVPVQPAQNESATKAAAATEGVTPRAFKAAAVPVAAPTAKKAATAETTIDEWMPNKTLQQWVLKSLNSSQNANSDGKTWSSVDQITQDDMLYLQTFTAQNYGTTYIDGKTSFSLEGLQYATNLTRLDLLNNMNQKPHALRGDITDISPLKALTKLTWLQLSGNRITDISPIADLKNLKSLSIGLNNIADFSSLDPTQYTNGFSVGQQFVEQKVVYVPESKEYVMVNPVKPPKGMTLSASIPERLGIPIFAVGFPNPTVRVFWTGATGSLSSDGREMTYRITKDQIMPGQGENPWAGSYPNMVQEDYTYFLNTNFSLSGNGQEIVVTLVTPYVVAAQAQPVTVEYVDQTGKAIAKADQLTGLVGEDYRTQAKTIDGYKLTETPTNATGKFTDEAQTVTYVYQEDVSTVTVHHQDKDGNELAPSETLSGQVGKDYEAKAKDILGYKLTETPANATGKFTDEAQTVTFVYDEAISSVTVHYQDKNGNELAPTETLSGQVGKAYEAKAKDIEGYKLTETPTNATGKFTDEAQTVTFVYDAAISSVTVHYQDKDGNELAPTETLSGQVGKAYEAKAKDIEGYRLTETPANATGKFTDESQTVTFVYDEAISSVTVHYQDKDGNALAPSETLSGQVGKAYEAKAKDIEGYKLTETPANATGKFTDEAQTVTFVYAEALSTVTVHYQDEQGQTLADSETLSGQVGTQYEAKAKTIAGYTLTATPANATGQFTDEGQVVYFIYRKDAVTPPVVPPTQQVTVTVRYQTADGQTVAPSVTLTGQPGEAYTTTPATVAGYRLVTTPENASGTYGLSDTTVTYVYEPDIQTGGSGDGGTTEKPDTVTPDPDKPSGETPTTTQPTGKPTSGGQAAQVTPTTVLKKTAAQKDTIPAAATLPTTPMTAGTALPQTNDQQTSSWWGWALLAGLGGWVALSRWKKRD